MDQGKLCQFYIDGYCRFGKQCHDIHDNGEEESEQKGRRRNEGGKERKPDGKSYNKPVKRVCRYFLNNNCRYGKHCWDEHPTSKEREEESRQGGEMPRREEGRHESRNKKEVSGRGGETRRREERNHESRNKERHPIETQSNENRKNSRKEHGDIKNRDSTAERTNKEKKKTSEGEWTRGEDQDNAQAKKERRDKGEWTRNNADEQMITREEFDFLQQRLKKISRYFEVNKIQQ